MSTNLIKSIAIFIALIASFLAAEHFKPTQFLAKVDPMGNLEEIIPHEFAGWTYVPDRSGIVADPRIREKLNTIYNQILSRTYVNKDGYVIMLSIAYGDDQRSDMAVHYPEVCYPAQGFSIQSNEVSLINTASGDIQVRKLVSSLGSYRVEPITYWTTIGNYVSLGGAKKRLIELQYGLEGTVPDGLLFRVSSISPDTDTAFDKQEEFINALLQSLPPRSRLRISGLK